MRNMSFMLTKKHIYDETKDVTRRLGWPPERLKVGDIVMACEKCQGLEKGESIVKIKPIMIVSNRPERLDEITQDDVIREGFPNLTPAEFVSMFCREMKCDPDQAVNRIEFCYNWPKTTSYRPSNSTEGTCFEAHFCDRCAKQGDIEHGPHCQIHFLAMMHGIEDPEFPEEWIWNEKGRTECTAFEKCRKFPKPYIIRNDAKIFFDAVFPVVYADVNRAEGYHINTGESTVIPSTEYFILRQLWPKHCYLSREMAMLALNPPKQGLLF